MKEQEVEQFLQWMQATEATLSFRRSPERTMIELECLGDLRVGEWVSNSTTEPRFGDLIAKMWASLGPVAERKLEEWKRRDVKR